jgi:hypothetical protein
MYRSIAEKRENKKPASKDTLDMDMDKCEYIIVEDDLLRVIINNWLILFLINTDWFKGGKGPNPEVAALDNDLDSYLAKKDAEPVPAPAAAVTAPAAVEEPAAAPAAVTA